MSKSCNFFLGLGIIEVGGLLKLKVKSLVSPPRYGTWVRQLGSYKRRWTHCTFDKYNLKWLLLSVKVAVPSILQEFFHLIKNVQVLFLKEIFIHEHGLESIQNTENKLARCIRMTTTYRIWIAGTGMEKRRTSWSNNSSREINDLYVIKNALMNVWSRRRVNNVRWCKSSALPKWPCDVRCSTNAGMVPARTLPSASMTISSLVWAGWEPPEAPHCRMRSSARSPTIVAAGRCSGFQVQHCWIKSQWLPKMFWGRAGVALFDSSMQIWIECFFSFHGISPDIIWQEKA